MAATRCEAPRVLARALDMADVDHFDKEESPVFGSLKNSSAFRACS